jgi:monoterpene epsilon-lactone hydrolase
MTTTHHPEYLPDRAAMDSIRAMLSPMKGSVDGPSAREPFDHMMESTPAAQGIAYEATSIGGVPGWWCLPGDATPHSAILYFHGGGYVVGSARAYRHFAGQFAARANVSTFVPDYGLAPERPFPAAIDDAGASYAGLLTQGFSKIALAGDSAGGGLALAMLSQAVGQSRAGAWPRPRGAAVISASTDLALTGESIEARADADPLSTRGSLSSLASLYLAGHDPRDPLASPLYGDLAGLPPVMMHVGEDDILLDDSIRYAERLEREGGTAHLHTWAGMIHVFPSNLALLQAANEALDNIGDFLKQQLSGDA